MSHPTGQVPNRTTLEREERTAVLRTLSLDGPDPRLDDFARHLAHDAQVPYAMVNIFGDTQQFLGLCTPGPQDMLPEVGRSMSLAHGYCPEVVARRTALVLPDVFSSPRFSGNEVVDLIGIRTYAGAPLIHASGVVLGTVCFVGPQEQPKASGQGSLALIKKYRDEVMAYLTHQAAPRPGP
ncbi:GAF domain-containing protein [Streptomyces sp. NPDC051555]|uniref:GAF domain-containing protein n=1 Tax=Streptomyces sp. NPDC051555 TaxID=3365657 RepID=UPI0037934C00